MDKIITKIHISEQEKEIINSTIPAGHINASKRNQSKEKYIQDYRKGILSEYAIATLINQKTNYQSIKQNNHEKDVGKYQIKSLSSYMNEYSFVFQNTSHSFKDLSFPFIIGQEKISNEFIILCNTFYVQENSLQIEVYAIIEPGDKIKLSPMRKTNLQTNKFCIYLNENKDLFSATLYERYETHIGETLKNRRKKRESELFDLGFEEPDSTQRRQNLNLNIFLLKN